MFGVLSVSTTTLQTTESLGLRLIRPLCCVCRVPGFYGEITRSWKSFIATTTGTVDSQCSWEKSWWSCMERSEFMHCFCSKHFVFAWSFYLPAPSPDNRNDLNLILSCLDLSYIFARVVPALPARLRLNAIVVLWLSLLGCELHSVDIAL